VVSTAKAPSSFLTLEKLSMKKTLIALAVLAASGASFAQSSVSLTGSIGTTLQASVTEGATNNARQGLSRSTGAIQLSGTEDLGGGMKASFRIEELVGGYQTNANRVTTGTGVNTGNFGSRQAFLALSGGFGTFKAGRDLDGNSQAISVGNISGANATAGLDDNKLNAVYWGNARTNSVSYTTPSFNGFTASYGITPAEYNTLGTAAGATTVAAGNVLCSVSVNSTAVAAGTACGNTILAATNPVAASTKQDNATALALAYSNGPLNVLYVNTNAQTSANIKASVIAANYDFGVARVGGLLQTVSADGKEDRTASVLSLNVPVGAVALQAAYGSSKAASAFSAAFSKEVTHSMIGAQYNLSKRTSAYVIMNTKKVDGATLNDGDYKETGIGMKHAF